MVLEATRLFETKRGREIPGRERGNSPRAKKRLSNRVVCVYMYKKRQTKQTTEHYKVRDECNVKDEYSIDLRKGGTQRECPMGFEV